MLGAQGMNRVTSTEQICVHDFLPSPGRPATQFPACPQDAMDSPGSAEDVTWSVPLVMEMADEAATAVPFL